MIVDKNNPEMIKDKDLINFDDKNGVNANNNTNRLNNINNNSIPTALQGQTNNKLIPNLNIANEENEILFKQQNREMSPKGIFTNHIAKQVKKEIAKQNKASAHIDITSNDINKTDNIISSAKADPELSKSLNEVFQYVNRKIFI
jgi:hypothetical protein